MGQGCEPESQHHRVIVKESTGAEKLPRTDLGKCFLDKTPAAQAIRVKTGQMVLHEEVSAQTRRHSTRWKLQSLKQQHLKPPESASLRVRCGNSYFNKTCRAFSGTLSCENPLKSTRWSQLCLPSSIPGHPAGTFISF